MPKLKDSRLKKKIEKRTADFLNKILIPAEKSYKRSRELLRKLKNKAPFLYNEIEGAIKPHIITLDKKEQGNIRVGDVIASNIIRNLPNVDEENMKMLTSDKQSKSFMSALAKTFGAATDKKKNYTVMHKKKIFNKVLIANRGEIALRIIRACRELGIEVEVIYAKEDKDSLSVKFADKAHCVGKISDYLNIRKIIDIAKKTKADAIHPGYGFLAENSEFARLCEKSRITFIGPTSKVISMLGDKVKAREKMQKYKVPILPGTGILKNKEQAIKESNRIGYPVILKAVAGGGGKGMRIVNSEKQLDSLFDQAQSEAKNAFGNKALYIEKYMTDVKHIEFQVLADKFGNAIHLGERDCTIQRKHQKLIEEAPSKALTPELREQMGKDAVKAVSALKYRGAGTVEFLLDKYKNPYFIEVNTRIQVEHGITEMVTGVDLVKEQIKLAAGAKLAFKQEDIKIEGYAIECRINAEDPCNDFLPSSGTISNYLAPGGPGIRVSSVCYPGYKVLPHFDSLLVLLMCSGKTRREALARMNNALEEYLIEGVKTTIPFHKTVINNKDFINAEMTTSFIEDKKIIPCLKKKNGHKKELKNGEKVLIVTTAVSEYLKKRQKPFNSVQNRWIMAARQEAMNQDEAL